MTIIQRIRRVIGCAIALPGAHMWQPAFDEGREDKYENLRWSEKLGYKIVHFGFCVVGGMTEEDLEEIGEKYENQD